MSDFMAARKRLRIYAKELHELAVDIDEESGELQMALAEVLEQAALAVLEQAALVADQVEAKAEPGHGKETAAEIGRRIRALMEDGR